MRARAGWACAAVAVLTAGVFVLLTHSDSSAPGHPSAAGLEEMSSRITEVERALRRADSQFQEVARALAALSARAAAAARAEAPPPREQRRGAAVEKPTPQPTEAQVTPDSFGLQIGNPLQRLEAALDRPLQAGSGPRRIPPVLHQTWSSGGSVPKRFLSWTEGWLTLHPNWRYEFWDDQRLANLIAEHFPSYSGTFASVRPIHRADIGRVAVLYVHGGAYADMDMQGVRSLDPLVAAADAADAGVLLAEENMLNVVLLEGREEDQALASNFMLLSRPGHPLWLCYLKRAFAAAAGGRCDPVSCTGPRMLDSVARDAASGRCTAALPAPPRVRPSQRPGSIVRLPWQYFSPEPAFWNMGNLRAGCTKYPRAARRVCPMLERVAKDSAALRTRNTFGVHHWQCSWCRSDPALMQTGRLSEALLHAGRRLSGGSAAAVA
eukprot:TRINITY_DN56021_c0_g1_i1.p1 TRINITY_DN56021_c0_g1~~TRINITY_DN56021_c0_g1_i1.p1  ORF type:complete len:437 (+),score=106.41 TRINITY_DN56021_c0_g1_i1:76-1386(+)